MPVAYSYIRMSRPEQLRGDSLRRQLNLSREYAAEHGLELDETLDLRDIGVSGFRGKQRTQGALGLFLRLAEEGKVPRGSYLLVENLDRLSREEVHVALQSFLQIISAGITIVTLADKAVFSSKTVQDDYTKLILSIVFMAKAHQESADKSFRLAEAWREKRLRATTGGGGLLTAKAPAWLKADKKAGKFFVLQDRAEVVQRIFRNTIDGLGAMTIARHLNNERIRPFGGSSGWHISSVKKILANEAVFGRCQPHTIQTGRRLPSGPALDDYYPAVIDQDTFWKARAAIGSRRTVGAGRKGKIMKNLFSGLAKCGICGSSMMVIDKGQPPKGAAYLECSSAHRRANCPNLHRFRLDQIELGALSVVATTNLSHRFNQLAQEQDKILSRIEVIDGRVAAARRNLERLLGLLDDDEEPDLSDALGAKIRRIRAEIKQLVSERKLLDKQQKTSAAMAATPGSMVDRVQHYIAHTDSLTDADERFRERARMAQELRRLISRIEFNGNSAAIKFHDGSEAGVVHFQTGRHLPGVRYADFAPGHLGWRLSLNGT